MIAFAVLVVAIPAVYGWTSLKAPFQSLTFYRTVEICNYPVDATCVCNYMDGQGYLEFKAEKCRGLAVGQSVSLSQEELSQASQYFSNFPNSRLDELAIIKTAENPDACTEKGYCHYVIGIGDSMTVRS